MNLLKHVSNIVQECEPSWLEIDKNHKIMTIENRDLIVHTSHILNRKTNDR